VIDSLPRFFFPTRRRGTRWLREQLRELGVTAPLSPRCLNDFVMSAAQATMPEQSSTETYAASLRKQLEARARFVHRWTTTDDILTQPEWSEWIAIARRHLLPRSWTIQQTTATESHRNVSLLVPERLIVRAPRGVNSPRPLNSPANLPGTEILSDLKRAGDQS
jgi:hypothetical protein